MNTRGAYCTTEQLESVYPSTVRKLARALNVQPRELLDGPEARQ